MFACHEVMRNISDYLNGKLAPEDGQELRWHVAHCQHCKIVLRTALETIQMICTGAEKQKPPTSWVT